MRKLLLYDDKEKPSAASIDGYLATMRDTNPAGGTEGDWDEALADEASTLESGATLYGIANSAKSGCTMKVRIPNGQFGVHKTKKGRMLEHECAWTKCFLIYQELRKTCLNDDYDYHLPKS